MSALTTGEPVDGEKEAADRSSAPLGVPSEPQGTLLRAIAPTSPKVMAREAMKRLKDNGIDLSNSFAQNGFIFYLAKVSPETLNTVVNAAVSSTDDEKRLWLYYLGDSISPQKGESGWDTMWRRYQRLHKIIPTATYLESTASYAKYAHQSKNLISLVERAYPDRVEDDDFMRAAAIVLHIKGMNEPFRNRRGDYDYSVHLPDIEYVANNVDEVEKIVPLLRSRETTDPKIIAALLSSATMSLSDGVL